MAVWLDRHTITVPGARIAKSMLLERYNADAIGDGQPTMTANRLGRSVKQARPRLASGQRKVAGRITEVWLDIAFRPAEWETGESGHSGAFQHWTDE